MGARPSAVQPDTFGAQLNKAADRRSRALKKTGVTVSRDEAVRPCCRMVAGTDWRKRVGIESRTRARTVRMERMDRLKTAFPPLLSLTTTTDRTEFRGIRGTRHLRSRSLPPGAVKVTANSW
jgi:hypothetical protein